MPSHSKSRSQTCTSCGPNGWLRTERLLSASCMGWCLQASFKEDPKSTTIACAGGASSIYLANFFLSRLASGPANGRLLRAGGLISVAGVSMCLKAAFQQHPKAAIKAYVAGALSMCLTKSVIFSDPSTSLEETPKKIKTTRSVRGTSDRSCSCCLLKQTEYVALIGKELDAIADYFDRIKSDPSMSLEEKPKKIKTTRSMRAISDMSSSNSPQKETECVACIGKELNLFADYFERRKSVSEDENNYVKRVISLI